MSYIKFRKNRQTWYRGRNGTGIQTGLVIGYSGLYNYVQFTPVNTRGESLSSILNVPLENIPQVIETLERKYKTHSGHTAITQTNKNETKKGKD